LTFAVASLAAPKSPATIVNSKEWKVRRAPEKEEEYIGDVSYRAGPTSLRADWALYRHAGDSWQARGRVRLEQRLSSGELVSAQGEEASFLPKTRRGSLTSREGVGFLRRPPEGEPDQGWAGRLDWEGQERISLTGGVRLWGPRYQAWAKRADYQESGPAPSLTLSGGRPVLRKLAGEWLGAVKADRVTAFENPRRISAEGKARGWIQFPEAAALPGFP